ncbi:MAG: hypothetical protein Hals2KO_38630 [Halioglobus sp.]
MRHGSVPGRPQFCDFAFCLAANLTQEFNLMKLPRWLAARKKSDPELPLRTPIPFIHNYSNGEYLYEQTPRDRRIEQAIYRRA